jgi:nitrogen fixation protein NifU and related proteins
MNDLRQLYQEVIVDHNRHPRNYHRMEDCVCNAEGFNPLCGDQLHLYLDIDDGVIEQASFVGKGCAISTASASLMTESLKGKTIDEAKAIFDKFHEALTVDGKAFDSSLGKLAVLSGVKEFPSRVKCAVLAWHTLNAALSHSDEVVTTE